MHIILETQWEMICVFTTSAFRILLAAFMNRNAKFILIGVYRKIRSTWMRFIRITKQRNSIFIIFAQRCNTQPRITSVNKLSYQRDVIQMSLYSIQDVGNGLLKILGEFYGVRGRWEVNTSLAIIFSCESSDQGNIVMTKQMSQTPLP